VTVLLQEKAIQWVPCIKKAEIVGVASVSNRVSYVT
jgi:hypothetical protein